MRFDVVPISSDYSGVDRSLMPSDFLTPETKPYYNSLLSVYFSYLDLTCDPCKPLDYNEITFRIIQDFYKKFRENNVLCELIIFDTTPLTSTYGVPVELLGIDIVHDMAESLISYNQQVDISIKKHLNVRGLFDDLIDANNVIDSLKDYHTIWKPCWVYKVIA